MTLALQKDPTTGRYIILFDASIYKESSCSRKLFYKLVRGLRSSGKDFKMEYGTAFHKAMVEHYSGRGMQAAIISAQQHYTQTEIFIPESDWRTPGHLCATVAQYLQFWQEDHLVAIKTSDGPLLEKTFSIPFYQDDKFEVLLTGTIDMIAFDEHSGYTLLVDHKTTSLTQVDNYLAGYGLSPQLMMYTMVYKLLFPEDSNKIGAMINGIFINKTGKTTFKRSEVIMFSDKKLQEFRYHLSATIMNLIKNLEWFLDNKEEAFPCNFTACETKFGLCDLFKICSLDDEDLKENLLSTEFTSVVYDPTKFQV